MANLLSDADVVDVEAYDWLIADTSRPDFGDCVTDEEIDEAVVLRDSAIIGRAGEEVYAKWVSPTDKANWLMQKEKAKGDARLFGDHRDSQANDSWTSNPGLACFGLRCPQWVNRYDSLSQSSGADMLRVGLGIDQLDLSNILVAELAARRLIQIETLVARNPASPNYTGLELLMEQNVGATGQAVTLTFNNWVASKLKDRANVQKLTRLYKEEFGGDRGSVPTSEEK